MAVEREINYKFSATENVTSVAGRVQRALKNARKSEGSEALDEIAKFTRGAGGLVVLDLMANGIERVTEQMKTLRAESLKMKLTLADKIESGAKSIPLYGQIIGAGRELRKELDGTNKYVEKQERRAIGDTAIGEATKRTADLRDTYHALEQRSRGQDLRATLIEIKTEREKAVGDLRKSLEKDMVEVTNPGQRAQLRQKYAEQAFIADRTRTVKETAAIEADRAAKAQKTFSFAEKGIEFLKQEADLGKIGTGYLAAKLQITTEFAKKQEEIGLLLKKDNLTQAETNALRAVQGGLGKQEREAIARLGVGDVRFSGGLAPTEQSSFLTGVGAAGRENDPALKLVANTDKAAKTLAEIFALMLKNAGAPAGVAAYTIK